MIRKTANGYSAMRNPLVPRVVASSGPARPTMSTAARPLAEMHEKELKSRKAMVMGLNPRKAM